MVGEEAVEDANWRQAHVLMAEAQVGAQGAGRYFSPCFVVEPKSVEADLEILQLQHAIVTVKKVQLNVVNDWNNDLPDAEYLYGFEMLYRKGWPVEPVPFDQE